jgi:predicted ATPase
LLLGIGGIEVWEALRTIQTVEINPARVGDLQEPTPPFAFEPDGSNTASIFEGLENKARRQLVDHLAALVPGVTNIQPRQLGDKLTLIFTQTVEGKNREFSAKQMSDGTLRAFGILTALMKPSPASLLVIEEPETAIHLGALRTLVEIFRAYTDRTQIVITTHSADIVDAVDLSQLRVVWSEGGSSRIAPIAAHAREPIQRGLITPGELLRSDSLDPAHL